MTIFLTLAIAVLGSGGLTAIIAKLIERGKLSADASKVISDAAVSLVEPLTGRIDALEIEVSECHAERDGLKDRVRSQGKRISALEALNAATILPELGIEDTPSDRRSA